MDQEIYESIVPREEILEFCLKQLNTDLVLQAERIYVERYSPYHSFGHALDVTHMALTIRHGTTSRDYHYKSLLTAAIAHDVYHTNSSPGDEIQSAEWVRRFATPEEDMELTAALIEATGHHLKPLVEHPAYKDCPELAEILLDADLAGLATPDYKVFVRQNNAVTKEVQEVKGVSDDVLYQGRLAFIEYAKKAGQDGFLFRTKWARERLLPIALANLDRYSTDLQTVKAAYL